MSKGLHWGKLDIGETDLEFKVHQKDQTKKLFKLPFNIINTSSINKNESILQLKDFTNSQTQQQDMLCEIRFFVDAKKLEQQREQEEKKKQIINYAEIIHQQITEKANIGVASGESIAKLEEISLGVPRGKYTIDFYERNLRFHGSTFNYNVDYKNIQKGFILPINHENKTAIVIQLSKPIIQGLTVHPFIVVLLPRDQQLNITTNVKSEYLKDHPHLEKVKTEYSGSIQSVVVELFKSITNIDLVIPGEYFKSKQGNPYVRCSRKANTGTLYFLKKSLIFVMKPVVYFKVDDIEKIQFHRVGVANKQFDLKIFIKGKHVDQYIGIQKSNYQAISDYFKQKKVKIVKVGGQQKRVTVEAGDDSSEDEDFEGAEQSDSEDDDDSQLIEESNSK